MKLILNNFVKGVLALTTMIIDRIIIRGSARELDIFVDMVNGRKLSNRAVTTARIADGAVTDTKITGKLGTVILNGGIKEANSND